MSLAPAFQRRGTEMSGAGCWPSPYAGLGYRPAAFGHAAPHPGCLESFLLLWAKAELWVSLGIVVPPVSRVWVWEPLCSTGSVCGAITPLAGFGCPRMGEKEPPVGLGTRAAL